MRVMLLVEMRRLKKWEAKEGSRIFEERSLAYSHTGKEDFLIKKFKGVL